ncbi:MAG: 1-acyl-sn-glycerol-3-phosphate acyltransferase [Elusimicrobiota bacterium]
MIVSIALSLISLGSPRAAAAVFAPVIGAPALVRSAPLPATSSPVTALALAALPVFPTALAPMRPAVAPAPAAAVPVPAAAAPALAAAPIAPAAAPMSATRTLAAASLPEPGAAEAAFDGGRPAALPDWSLAVGPIETRPPARLQLLSAADLGVEGEPQEPRPPSSDPKPLLYRHYRLVRALVLPVLRLFYDVGVEGASRISAGPVLIVPNHVSFLDPVLISFAANRPMRFLMYRPIYETRGLQWLFRSLGAIPISTKDPKGVIEESLNRARRALAAGESVVIFPEGVVTRDGNFSPFRRGFERVALGLGVPVVPAHIDGMWGSILSRHPLKGWRRSLLARLRGRRRAVVRFGPPLERADAGLAREAVARLAAR